VQVFYSICSERLLCEQRSNDTHQSITDPEARMYRKSFAHPARLCYAGDVLSVNARASASRNASAGRNERTDR
jgi:hypothetical protein